MIERGIEDLKRFASVYTGETQVGGGLYHTLHIHTEEPLAIFDAIAPMIRDNVQYREQQGMFEPTIETYVPVMTDYDALLSSREGASYQASPPSPRSLAIIGNEPREEGSYMVAVKLTESDEGTQAEVELRWPKAEGESLPTEIPKSATLDDFLHAVNPGAYHELVQGHKSSAKVTEEEHDTNPN